MIQPVLLQLPSTHTDKESLLKNLIKVRDRYFFPGPLPPRILLTLVEEQELLSLIKMQPMSNYTYEMPPKPSLSRTVSVDSLSVQLTIDDSTYRMRLERPQAQKQKQMNPNPHTDLA